MPSVYKVEWVQEGDWTDEERKKVEAMLDLPVPPTHVGVAIVTFTATKRVFRSRCVYEEIFDLTNRVMEVP